MNLLSYSVGSFALAFGVITKAYYQYHQYYPTMVYLVQSKACHLVMANFVLVVLLLIGKLIKTILLGSLRDNEVENLQERLWPTIMDTLLAMTVFQQDEFNMNFFLWFGSLLAVKIFHWLANERIDFMTRSLSQGTVTYLRLISLMLVLSFIDGVLLLYCSNKALNDPPSIMLLFSFEYGILTVFVISLFIKFAINGYDLYQAGRWEGKGIFKMYLDFVVDLVNLLVYMSFFFTLFHYYGLPIHLIRQLYVAWISFQKRFLQIHRYHTATRDLDRRFPLALPRQLSGERADDCIVCREPMESGRVLPCGHIMHRHCLLSWLELSQTCPICRVSVLTELNDNNNQQNPMRHQPHGVVPHPGNAPYPPPPEWNNAPAPFHFQPYQPPNNNNPAVVVPPPQPAAFQPPIEQPQQQIDPREPQVERYIPPIESVPQPNDISRIEAHVELMQEQLAILQEQFGVLLSDIKNYKRLYGETRPSYNPVVVRNNTEDTTSKLEQSPELQTTISSPSPPSEKITSDTEKPSATPEVDPEREEIRKRRLLRFSSEHTLARPDN